VFFTHDTSIPVIHVFRFLHASFSIAYEAVHDIMSAPRAFTFTTVSFLFPVRTASEIRRFSGARRYRTQALQIIVFAAPTFQILTRIFDLVVWAQFDSFASTPILAISFEITMLTTGTVNVLAVLL